MKKCTRFVSVFSLAMLAMVGCSTTKTSDKASEKSSDKASEKTSEKASETPVAKEELVIGSPTKQQTWVKTKIEGYLTDNNLSSKYTVKMVALEEGDVNNASAVPDWTAKTAPDIYAYASDQTLNLVAKGALAQVPSTFASNMKTAMGDDAMAAAKVGDKTYGYPYAGDNGYFLYYNKSVFNGKTDKLEMFDDVVNVCKDANLKVSYNLSNTFYSTGLMFTFGARYTVTLSSDSKSIASVDADFNSDKGMKAITAMKGIINNSNVDCTGTGQKAPTVANGLGACVDGSWNAASYKEAMGDDYGCIKLPSVTVDGETKNIGSFLGYKLYGVNASKSGTSTSKLGDLHKIANYLVSKDVQVARFNDLTIAPTIAEVKNSDAVKNTPHVAALAAQASYSVAQTIVPNNIWQESTAPYTELVKAENKDADTTKLQSILDAYNTAVKTVA